MKLLLYPNGIGGGQRISHFRQILNFEWTLDPSDPDITHAIYHDKKNRKEYPDVLREVEKRGITVWNKDIVSIKKSYVFDMFLKVFGYDIRIDPTKHRGVALKRTEQNAIHNAKFIECPIPEWQVDTTPRVSGQGEPHYRQYVRMIDTRVSRDKIRDYRLSVIKRKPYLLFEKLIDSRCMFHVPPDVYFEVRPMRGLHPVFFPDEIEKIEQFIEEMKLDYGEIDLLRNNSTGLIYIVDVNDIPAGALANHIPRDLLIEWANEFKRLMLC